MASEVEILRGEGGRAQHTGCIATIPIEHKLIHERQYYFINRAIEGSSAVFAILLKTGAKTVHITPTTKTSGKVVIGIFEGVTVTNDGTALVCRNYNRNGEDDGCLSRAFHTPTYTGGVQIKFNQSGFGSSPGNAVPGDGSSGVEYVLKPNTSYVFLQTPGSSIDQVFVADFYEV